MVGAGQWALASSASFSSLLLQIRLGRMQALGSRGGEPWFYLRLGLECSRTGLTLFRVLRKGLWLCEYLGGLPGRANAQDETAFRTHVPNSWSRRRDNDPTAAAGLRGRLLRLRR